MKVKLLAMVRGVLLVAGVLGLPKAVVTPVLLCLLGCRRVMAMLGSCLICWAADSWPVA